MVRTIEVAPTPEKKGVILAILFLAWGINQIFNDYLGLEEDRINAPDRPMVTGELQPRAAVLLSTVLMIVAIAVTWSQSKEPIDTQSSWAIEAIGVTTKNTNNTKDMQQETAFR